ncbi:hypothetical protein WJX84_000231 [Apatococcus fuscideae]|uniref:Tyrosine specific protein phosphatases domain-containing protein n=1 Tax=Apatococcus fuscideae TaxID=2026836 RepID=A0AAW1T3R1_9CHLO
MNPGRESGLASETRPPPQLNADLLPDLSIQDPGAPPPSEYQRVPSVLQKLQKWGDYPSYGEPVEPTLFLPMKTPLSTTIHRSWTLDTPPLHSLTVQQLLAEQAMQQRTVGLILDLSNHATLYEEDLPVELQYEHIMLQSKVFPARSAIDEVVAAAQSFWSRQPSQYIAIHCAYGFNRTGFVICSYLIQACGLSVEAALASFAAARPPGVKHEQFVAELHTRYPAASSAPSQSECSADSKATAGGMGWAEPAHHMADKPNPLQSGPGRGPPDPSQDLAGAYLFQPLHQQAQDADPARLQQQSRCPYLEGHSSSPHPSNLASLAQSAATEQAVSTSYTLSSSVGICQGCSNTARQPEGCSSSRGPEAQAVCPGSLPCECVRGKAADVLFKAPSQGIENESLGLDQRAIMRELAASRLQDRSRSSLEPVPSE